MKKLGLDDILETERCLIKIPQINEVEFIWNLITPQVTENMLWDKWEDSSQTYENLLKARKKAKSWDSWDAAIYLKETWKCIWRCGIPEIDKNIPSVSIWYWLSPKYWWKWIIPECVDKLLSTAFNEMGMINAVLCADSNNMKSRRVAEKCWFTLDGVIRRERKVKWTVRDVAVYTMLKEEYNK